MRIFSGIQPTGRKHLGNYIGAIRQYVEGQDRGDPAIYCIVDLHATTVPYDPVELRERLYDTAAILLAAGLDPERCVLFRQGDVREHTELTWLLCSVTALGELNRMHQFRDKGEDQREHLELMRDIARRFNARFGDDILVVPEHRIPEVGARIMDLQDPTRKMSTTGGIEEGTIYVLDEPAAIEKKVKRAVTDSDDPPQIRRAPGKPGVSNLLDLLAAARGAAPAAVEAEMQDARGYGDLKGAVATAVVELLAPVRERYAEIRADEAALEAVLAEGAEKARALAAPTLADVREAMGVGPRRR